MWCKLQRPPDESPDTSFVYKLITGVCVCVHRKNCDLKNMCGSMSTSMNKWKRVWRYMEN